jgi:AbiV family abortive infection protein
VSANSDYLLKGTAYALEQCGLLLRDANILYRNGSYASAIVLTAFAREELGRSSILFNLWRRALGGETFTISEIRQACDDHVTKQSAGMLSLTIRADRASGLGKLLQARVENHPRSLDWQKANSELKRIDNEKKKRTPTDRHERRIAALYVEAVSPTEWNRPIHTRAEAYEFLVDAVNDYGLQYQQRYITGTDPILKQLDPELYGALAQWSDRPVLPAPEHPIYPGSAPDAGSSRSAVARWGRSLIAFIRQLRCALMKGYHAMRRALMKGRADER